ncbi:alpha-1,6-mannosyl-glycoprotein 4-beta-N-acetylglucosaminyltransferase-like [Glossophaga mutica]
MRKRPPVLQHATYRVLAGAPPQEKKLLTAGISSVQRPHGSALLDTLQSLFQASSGPELHCIVVLVHLSDPDPEWLRQMAAAISSLFQPHIEARELLVIHGRLGGSPDPGDPGDAGDSSPCATMYSRQKVDYTLLMNFALNLSEYFLMMEDHVQCAPKFVSAIYWALSAWKEQPWVTLEFSSLSFSGKVFHTSEPDNPVASVLTDMRTIWNTIPEYAYVLNKESYYTLDPLRGNYLTVVLERPQKVIRVEVLTGSDEQGLYRLQQGQVELGYSLLPHSEGCARYALLGPLVEGHLDQRVFDEDDAVEPLSCIRLLVLASQDSWLLIRQIRVWTQPEEEEEESWTHKGDSARTGPGQAVFTTGKK